MSNEIKKIKQRYARRSTSCIGEDLYSFLNPAFLCSTQERQRAILALLKRISNNASLSKITLAEIGCGSGGNLLDFIRFGLAPENMQGIELLPERAQAARRYLPISLPIHEGDASIAWINPASLDIVFQSVVFSSLLDDDFQQSLADRMWQWVKPGGGILWYDFIYNNPANPDVRGVPVKRIRELFPEGQIIVRRITLAPPISRQICRIHPNAYHLFNVIPWLRTHVLCWIEKQK